MNMIKLNAFGKSKWDEYVINHPSGMLYHLHGWGQIIQRAYRKKPFYIASVESTRNEINGILSLVHLKNFFFGNSVISLPYFDLGGILSDNKDTNDALISESAKIAKKLGAQDIELRQAAPLYPLSGFSTQDSDKDILFSKAKINSDIFYLKLFSNKFRMLLDLPESPDILLKSFKSKLRSQIKRPIKAGFQTKIGGMELLDDFYKVFCINMRDLGSPVHSKNLIKFTLEEFNSSSRIFVVYKDDIPVSCSLGIGFKDTFYNPWASSLRKFSGSSPNMLLYWAMLKLACEKGYRKFDFGRSSLDEGTYRFKKQWGAEPEPIYWQYINQNSKTYNNAIVKKDDYSMVINCWKKLPVPVSKFLGPIFRKNIPL